MRDFRKIIAWQKAHAVAVAMHVAIDEARFRVRPRLRSQLLRAIDSVAATIAEGSGKRTSKEFARYLDIALGSAREVDNHLLLARDIGCLEEADADRLLADHDEVKRLLYSYARSVRQNTDRFE
jgi:four helix bundle protein